ncbi:MAG: hypothetical protein JNL02_05120, partial [Saprospiraceae bacterium]|nr:hypothetical protein [Saprospiraceae bacterium]
QQTQHQITENFECLFHFVRVWVFVPMAFETLMAQRCGPTPPGHYHICRKGLLICRMRDFQGKKVFFQVFFSKNEPAKQKHGCKAPDRRRECPSKFVALQEPLAAVFNRPPFIPTHHVQLRSDF